jgi:hypothetical protein
MDVRAIASEQTIPARIESNRAAGLRNDPEVMASARRVV